MAFSGWRDVITEIAPTFLKRVVGQKNLYVLGATLDFFLEVAMEGVNARFPSVGTPSAYPELARDRNIVLGFQEPVPSQKARLIRSIDDHRIIGSPPALLDQLAGYLATFDVRIATVTMRGTWYVREPDGEITVTRRALNFNWQNELTTQWSRYWVIIWPLSSGVWDDEGEWGVDDTAWGDGGTWGTNATLAQIQTVREIVRTWRAAGRRCVNIIIAFDDASFDPSSPPGAPMPDGTWRNWGVIDGADYVESRLDTARYWDGTSVLSHHQSH